MHCCCCSGLQFGVYELVKGLWIQQRGLSPTALIGDIANLVMGLISGCVTQSLTCPIKTIAIRIGAGVAGGRPRLCMASISRLESSLNAPVPSMIERQILLLSSSLRLSLYL